MGETILRMRGITKRFGSLTANDRVDFDLRKGEIHALLGENGAGKTTLMNVLYGIYTADAGEITLYDKPFRLENPKDAIAHGIGMVHQHFMLVPPMTALQNIVLGQSCTLGRIDLAGPRKAVRELCGKYKFQLDLDARVADLSVGAQQRVELVKALYRGADILILDEPTAVLTPQEVRELFAILQQFIDQGKSIILISHKLWEVKRFSDRVTVLRGGKLVDTVDTDTVTEQELAEKMVGKSVTLSYDKTPVTGTDAVLEVSGLCIPGQTLASSVKDISFRLRQGEILGVAGVDGNGQLALAQGLMGLSPVKAGKVLFMGEDITCLPTRKRMERGFAYIPEDRMSQGLIQSFSVCENYVLNCYDEEPFTHKGVFSGAQVREYGERLTEEYDVRPRAPQALARSFSGGNQQKIIIAREFARDPRLIIAVQPTRGLDVGASEFVHHRLLEAKARGVGVLLISADLDEILAVADRALVINEGQIMGEIAQGETDYVKIGMMMGGMKQAGRREGETA